MMKFVLNTIFSFLSFLPFPVFYYLSLPSRDGTIVREDDFSFIHYLKVNRDKNKISEFEKMMLKKN